MRSIEAIFALLLATLLAAAAAPCAAADKEPVYIEFGLPTAEAVRFEEATPYAFGDKPDPTLSLLVVLTDRARLRPPGVAYFQLKLRMDCASHTVTPTFYKAWSAKGAVVSLGGSPPTSALSWASGPEVERHWADVCRTEPVIALPPAKKDQSQSGQAKAPEWSPFAEGIEGALEFAKRRQADLEALSSLGETGRFIALNRPNGPGQGVLLLDVAHLTKSGDDLSFSWLFVFSDRSGRYGRASYTADCGKHTGSDLFSATYDADGKLISLIGATASAPFGVLGSTGQFMSQLCGLPSKAALEAVEPNYPNVAAAVSAGKAMLIQP
jgi:hypothetical protein